MFFKIVLKNVKGLITITRKKTLNMEIKQINHTNIYQFFLKNNNLTKQDLVSSLQICLPTVTQNIGELMDAGLIAESGSLGNTGGRRAKTYSIIRDARIAIGLDITRNHITAVAVDLTGTIMTKIRNRVAFETSDTYYRYVGEVVATVVQEANVTPEQILGVGIGLPGLVTADGETVFYGNILNFTGTTRAEFSRYIPYRTTLFNDANAAAFTEIWANHELKNIFYIMLSNNIGGSVVINNQVYVGDSIKSGEIGHIPIVPGGKPCYCGQSGCVDAYLAATELSRLTDGNLSQFFQRLESGDARFSKVWNQYLDYLAVTVNIVHTLFDCPVILGGYVGEHIEPYMDDLNQRTRTLNPLVPDESYLLVCSYKTEAIAAGSALNFIADFLDSI